MGYVCFVSWHWRVIIGAYIIGTVILLVAYSMRIACHCVDCVLSWKETRAQSLYFNHSHVFVLTLKYGTASDGMAAANGCARRQ